MWHLDEGEILGDGKNQVKGPVVIRVFEVPTPEGEKLLVQVGDTKLEFDGTDLTPYIKHS